MSDTKKANCLCLGRWRIRGYAVGRPFFLKKERIACLKSSLKIRAFSVLLCLKTNDSCCETLQESFIYCHSWMGREVILFRHVLWNEQVIHAALLIHEGVEKTLLSAGSRTCWIYSRNNLLRQLENENEFTLKRKMQGKRIFYDTEKAFSSWNVLIFVISLHWCFYFCDNKLLRIVRTITLKFGE